MSKKELTMKLFAAAALLFIGTQSPALEGATEEDGPQVIDLSRVSDSRGVVELPDPGMALWDLARVTEDGHHLVGVGPSPTDESLAEFIVWDLSDPQLRIVERVTAPREFTMNALRLTSTDRLSRVQWSAVVHDGLEIYEAYEWIAAVAPEGLEDTPAPFRVLKPRPNVKRDFAPATRSGHTVVLPGASHGPIDGRKMASVEVPGLSTADRLEGETETSWIRIETTIRGDRSTGGSTSISSDLSVIVANVAVLEARAAHGIYLKKRSRVAVWDVDTRKRVHEYDIPRKGDQVRRVFRSLGFSPGEEYWVGRSGNGWGESRGDKTGLFVASLKAPWRSMFIDTPTLVHDVFWDANGTMWLVLSRAPDQSSRPEIISQLQPPPQLVPIDVEKLWNTQ
jgi:hypothetical protein